MTLNQLFASAAIVATLPLTALADSAVTKAFVLEALKNTLLAGDVAAVDQYFATDITQHNEMFANGIDAQKGVVGFLAGNGNFKADYVRMIADGDIVAVHARYEGFGETPMIGFDVFRVEDGKIVEHWDNLIPEQPANPSGRSQIDGATAITDLDQTAANKAKVKEFITRALINQEQVDFTQYINPANYAQHNPMVADGLDGFGAFMAEMAAQGISMEYTDVHQVIGEGNFVLTLSEGALGGEPTAFYDLFRVEDGLIVEHWDVIAPMPGEGAAHNEAGKF
ncbi:nuclear transport factor 2 family protein [Sulfitobacter guttiformis]|uniref:Putative SnoaL-like aldol condensation-catalyzing enzyme n=1 Tax=Sulfitobacter guttiformis TaxID=74349 RepID=A0A420DS60_9RHOB|nr:nuclear transport factor 2 family protein [Sulfitobacter guttiformis]KIN74479.1 putative lipoprotein [Sulfitobacter guttiformis KCTC 32187]RKE97072.1 putative SnoaL-like aldol condensation-catalyzing enzyme [Sulfitobacter guttiformis]